MKQSINGGAQVVLILVLGILTLVCLLPLVLIIIVSFSAQVSVSTHGFSFFPTGWSLDGWKYVLKYGNQVLRSYAVTIYETFVGTGISLLFTSMFAYALSRRKWALRGFLSVFLLITMLFNGGIVASYIINTTIYHMKDSLLILILPGAVSAFYCIVMRTFIQTNVPDSLVEAAHIDGAGEFYLFFRIVLPVMMPSLAAIGFLTAVEHWNEWQTALLYMTSANKIPLQLMLIQIEKSIDYLKENLTNLSLKDLIALRNAPTDPMRMAILLATLGPILIAYPFFQRYFVKGITLGSVKG